MNREQILDAIKTLANGQGTYGRLLQDIESLHKDNPELYETLMANLEAQNFKDTVDMVLYFEQ